MERISVVVGFKVEVVLSERGCSIFTDVLIMLGGHSHKVISI